MTRKLLLAGLILSVFAIAIAQQAKGPISKNYLAAAEALAADNLDGARTALGALAKESEGVLKTQAQAAADASDIAALRKAFKPLSETVIKMEIPAGYSVVFCPMFDANKGASWVQKQGKVANPYFGQAMLSCGVFK